MGLLEKIENREKASAQSFGIETDIDKMHNIIMKYGRMSINDIASILKADVKRVEELGKILSKYKMVELYYPPIGIPELRNIGHNSPGKTKNKNLNLIIFGLVLLVIAMGAIVFLKIYGII